jgi:uncharacterized protein YkwD
MADTEPQQPEIPTPPQLTDADKAVHKQEAPELSISSAPGVHVLATAHATLTGDQAAALKVQNDGRKGKGLAPLVWDNTLVHHAQQWANHLAQIDKMEHSTGSQRPGEGENLAWAW